MKKTLAVLAVIACMFGLVACGSPSVSESTLPFDIDQAEKVCKDDVVMLDVIVRTDQIEQYADSDVIYNGLLNWRDSLAEIGEMSEVTGARTEVKTDETIVYVDVDGSKRDAVVEFVLDENGAFKSITTSPKYTMGELMTKAGLNTLIGMGTVFAVLILICLIISCFKIISKLQNLSSGKDKTPAKTVGEQAVDNTIAQIIQKEDDLELVAVITAAIAAAEGSAPGATGTDGYVVRSIRRRA